MFDEVYENTIAKFPDVKTVAVDSAYKTPWICKNVQEDGRNISTAYRRPMTKKGFFKSWDYVYDEFYDCIICPNNEVLKYSTINRDGYREFKSNPKICKSFPHLNSCTQSKNHQKVVLRHIWEKNIKLAEDFRHSPTGKASYSPRSQTIERVFANTKENHGLRYTLLRGLNRVSNWVKLKFAVLNLKSDTQRTQGVVGGSFTQCEAGNVGLDSPFFIRIFTEIPFY